MHIFFAQRSTKKVKGVTDVKGLKPRTINKVRRPAHPSMAQRSAVHPCSWPDGAVLYLFSVAAHANVS